MANRWTTTVVKFLGRDGKSAVFLEYDPPGGGPVFKIAGLVDADDAQSKQDFVDDVVAKVTAWDGQRQIDDALATVLDQMLENAYP